MLRTLAEDNASILDIWTGTKDVMTLRDENNNPVDIWLGKDSVQYFQNLPAHQ